MKSNIKRSIAKKASQSLLTFEDIGHGLKIAHLSYLGKSAVESKLNSVLTVKKWVYDEESSLWFVHVTTLGGTEFDVEALSMEEVIDECNKYYEEISKKSLTKEK